MKKKLSLLLGLVAIFIACDRSTDEVMIGREPKLISCDQGIIITDGTNNLFREGVYKLDKLSLIATDENWNDLYINGNRISDMEGRVRVRNVLRDTDDKPYGVFLIFCYEYERNGNFITSYYKFQYDDEKYDYIKVIADGTDGNHILKTIYYNGVEYLLSDIPDLMVRVVKN